MRFVLTAVTAIVFVFGFIGPASAQDYSAALDGLQEVPPNASPASGSGLFNLDGDNVLTYNISFSGLVAPETGAHIHGPGSEGVNAPVVFSLPAGSPKIGFVGPLTAAQAADLNAGLYYVNIHSSTYPGGEIRGQILATAVPVENSSWGAIKGLFDSE
jgi:hypothetical protein